MKPTSVKRWFVLLHFGGIVHPMIDLTANIASFRNPDRLLPLEYVSRIAPREHVALLSQDTMYANLNSSWYIQMGLDRGETCIFATRGEPQRILEQLGSREINVDRYEKENLLHVCRISDARHHKYGLSKGVEKILDQLFSLVNPTLPTRIVSEPWVGNLTTPCQIEENQEVERNVHAAFQLEPSGDEYSLLGKLNGSLICSYEIEANNRLTQEWVQNHLANHHGSIVIPRYGTGVVQNSSSKHSSS